MEVGLVLLLDQFEALIGAADAELTNVAQALGTLARSGRVLVSATRLGLPDSLRVEVQIQATCGP